MGYLPAFPTIPTATVTQKFNNLNPSMYGGDHRHKGLDFGVATNNDCYASWIAEVIVAVKQQTGYGRHIRLLHPDGAISIYGHLSKLLVEVGDKVEAGQLIGKTGGDPTDGIDGDGYSTGAHLHWEVRPKGVNSDQGAIDPMEYFISYLPTVRQELYEVTAQKGLYVRASPVNGRVIRSLYRKEVVKIVETKDNWARILSIRPEWCWMQYLYFTGEVINPEPPAPPKPGKLDLLWDAHPELHHLLNNE